MTIKVPVYKEGTRANAYALGPMPRYENVNAGLAAGINDMAADVQAMEERNAMLEAESALQSFVRDTNSLLLTGENPYFGSQGEDSVKRMQPTIDQLGELKKKYLGSVTNPRAANLLKQSIERKYTGDMARIQQRALGGQQEWDLALAKTQVEQAGEQIQLYINDPVKVRAGEASIAAGIRAANPGMPEESIKEATETAVSAAIAAGIDAEIQRSPGAAQGMLEGYAGKLEPDHLKTLKAKLKTHVDLQRVQAAYNDIRRQHPGDPRAQRDAANKLFGSDVKLQDELKRRLTNEYNYDESLKTKKQADLFQHLSMSMYSGTRLSKFLPEVMSELTHAQRASLIAFEAARSKGVDRNTNPEVQMYLAGLPDSRLAKDDFNPYKYYESLSNKHWDQLLKRWQGVRNGQDTGDVSKGLRSNLALVNDALETISGDDARDEAFEIIDEEISRIHSETGKPPTQADVRFIVEQVMLQRPDADKGMVWDSDAALYEIDYSDVPETDRKKITEAYNALYPERAGTPPTEAYILRMYRRKLIRAGEARKKVQQVNRSPLVIEADQNE